MNLKKYYKSLPKALAALAAASFAGGAMAQTSGGSGLDVSGIVSGISASNSQITAVITAVGLALVIILAWSLVRRAMGK